MKNIKSGMLSLGLFLVNIKIFFKLTLDTINKDLKTSKIFIKESFELKLYDRSGVFMVALMLSLFEVDGAMKKYSNKEDIVYLYCA